MEPSFHTTSLPSTPEVDTKLCDRGVAASTVMQEMLLSCVLLG